MVIKKKKEKIVEMEKFIAKGSAILDEKSEWTQICLRIPKKFIKNIDSKLEKRLGLSRNAWILEAIQEKIGK